MLEAMIEMGKALLEKSDLISERIKNLEAKTDEGAPRHVVKIDFRLDEEVVKLDLEEIEENTAKKYFYLGWEGGSNNPQWHLSFEKCNNLISQSLPNFANKLEDGELKKNVLAVIQKYYLDFGQSVDRKYRYLLDIHKFFGVSTSIYKLLEVEKKDNPKDAYKKLVSKVSNIFSNYCLESFELKKDQIGLYVVLINGHEIVNCPEYLEEINKFFKNILEGNTKKNLYCSVCGSSNNCKSDLYFDLKYYNIHQCIFAHKMNQKNYYKNFVLCKECNRNLLAAEGYVMNKLDTQIGSYDVYIVPHIIYGKQIDGLKIKKMAEVINPVIDTSKNINDLRDYRDKVIDRLEILNNDGYVYLLNFIFYTKLQKATKINKMIKDIQPSVFCIIQNALFDASTPFKTHFNKIVSSQIDWKRDLKMIYFMHPIKLTKQNPAQYQKLLWIYENVFCRKKIRKEIVFTNMAEVFQIVCREREGYNVSSTKKENFVYKVIEAMYYVHFLKIYGSMEGGEVMDVSKLGVSEETKAYIKEMGYNEQQTAMFLLGMLVGSIGRRQSGEGEEGTYKPILNKINYAGMDEARIIRLSEDVFKKLKQEKILGEYNNESIFNEHCKLFGKERDRWKLNKNESLFYLLSGYAYQTMKKKKTESEDND